MPENPIDEVIVFLGIILGRQLLMCVAQVNVGTCEVRQ